MHQKSIISPIISILISTCLLITAPALVSADYDCSQFDTRATCESQTNLGCEWGQAECLYNEANIPNSENTSPESNVEKPFSNNIVRYWSAISPNLKPLDSPGLLLSSLLPYLLSGAGIILFAMLIMGGFDIMTAATDAKKAEAGKSRITAAVIGFVIIFAAYWIAQILEILFGVSILK